MTVLLGYIDYRITLKNVGYFPLCCYYDYFNALQITLKEANLFIKRIRVSNTCKTEFRILISLGDKPIHLFRLRFKVNSFCFILKGLFYSHLIK